MASQSRNVCIVAGEASGDLQGALIVPWLRLALEQSGYHDVSFWGAAGPLLRNEGVEPVVTSEELAVMGFAEILSVFTKLSEAYHRLIHEIRVRKPLAIVLIDYPGFNLRLAQEAYLSGETVVYHIPPKVWAHGLGRVKILRDFTHVVTSILPFETSLLSEEKVNAAFVGNPLRDNVEKYLQVTKEKRLVQAEPFSPAEPAWRIGLLPGSRKNEILKVLPTLVEAFALLCQKRSHSIQGYIPIASTLDENWVKEIASEVAHKNQLPIERLTFGNGNAYDVMHGCHYGWICSGTATLEAAFFGLPMSVVYRVNPLTYEIGKRIVRIDAVSLVNLCAESKIVPEFLQSEFNAKNLVAHSLEVLESPQKGSEMQSKLFGLKAMFPTESSKTAADIIVATMKKYDVDPVNKFRKHKMRLHEKGPLS
jgi:lipid-A-disaccharide synthase